MPTTRAPAAAARWSGPVSLEITRSDSAASAASWSRLVRPQRSRTGTGPRSAHELIDERSIVGRADGDQARAEFRDGPAADLGEMLGRPALGLPPRSQVEHDPGRRHARQDLAVPNDDRRLPIGRLNRGSDASASKCTRRPPDALDGVQPQPGRVDQVGVEPARPLARIGHADADLGPRGGGHECRPEQPLQIDRQVKPAAAQLPEQAGRSADPERIEALAARS